MKLSEYFEHSLLTKQPKQAVWSYRTAVRKFEAFDGKAKLRDIDRAKLIAFTKWYCAQGGKPSAVKRYCATIRMIVRYWNPARFAERFPRRITPIFEHSGIDGTLDCAFLNRFRRGSRIRTRRTVRQYGITLRLFSEQLGRAARLDDLSTARVSAFLTWLGTEHQATKRTVANHAQRISAMWRWAYCNWLVKQPPTWI
jgi:site-specific recombinase XerD